jgi:iron complex outermembrane recepter protein
MTLSLPSPRSPRRTLPRGLVCLFLTPLAFSASPTPPPEPLPEVVQLPPQVVVTAQPASPRETVLDPKAPAQPLPAQDGADVLKSIPGISVIRKGGTDGDPVFRGMAGSRLGIHLDGQVCLGGCGQRMDPPTAYVFPAAYDRVRLLKGPQSVLHGPGQSAGLVLFESDPPDFARRGGSLELHATAGNWGRLDLAAEGEAGSEEGFARFNLTRTRSGNYEDGHGAEVHSRHLRWSAHTALGWTPAPDTLVQFSSIASDGEAAYADRMMDGTRFERQSHSLRARRERISDLVARAEFEIGLNAVDHVMDNYSLRPFTPTMMMPHPTVSNPDRRTLVARTRVALTPGDGTWAFELGADHQTDRHRVRNTMNQNLMPYQDKPRTKDGEFSQSGVFGEATYALEGGQRLVAGLRLDRWTAEDARTVVPLGMMGSMPNPTAGAKRDTTLASGFLRYERDLAEEAGSVFLGLGHVARFPDYWELFRNESPDSPSAFLTAPERTTQLDLGASRRFAHGLELTASLFASRIDDFALVQSGFAKPSGMMGGRPAVVTRSVDARTWGGELAASWLPAEGWRFDASLAYTRGENTTDDRPLAQIPPLEGRLGLAYSEEQWSVGSLLRLVAAQNRVAVGQGNIVGQDIGPSDGFATFALHATWRPRPSLRLSAGVDNLFDKTYAEHLSRSGAAVAGFPQTTRVNEPGRTLWTRLDLTF